MKSLNPVLRACAKLRERVEVLKFARQQALLLALGLLLPACSTVNVRVHPEAVVREGIESANLLKQAPEGLLASVGQAGAELLRAASQLDGPKGRAEAAGHYLEAAIEARASLLSPQQPATPEAELALRTLHNDSLARFAELWREASDSLGRPLTEVRLAGRPIQVRWAADSTYGPGFFDELIAAKSTDIKGITRRVRPGLGAALVGVRHHRPERAEEMEFYTPRGLHAPATMTLDEVARDSVVLSLRNPTTEQQVQTGGRTFPVAADFSAPLGVNFAGRNEWLRGLGGFFGADDRAAASGIYLTEPYDPDRIPVLLIHGLISVPIIWRDIIPRVLQDPELARRYQLMTFSYPSSYPIIESAAFLRDELKEFRTKYDPEGQHPLSRNMVVIGHSMGGILGRSLATEFGDNLWDQLSAVPMEKLPLTPAQKARAVRLAFFPPDPAVRRLLFYSTPHRGAHAAENGLIGVVARAATLPVDIVRATTVARALPKEEIEALFKVDITKKVTAVQSLRPSAPMIQALELSPIRPGVVYHSVVGDRGKGDTPDSSDGVVDYWSSHLEGAAWELIVPSGHASFQHPAGIEEAVRVLRLHAGLSPP